MRLGDATVHYCLQRYGPSCSVDEVLEIIKVSRPTLDTGMRQGRYPRPERRGVWSTEKVARASAGLPFELERASTTESGQDDEDPFC